MVGISAEISTQQKISKFAGEEFDVSNVRTVFAGASKDNIKRADRVILLVGPIGSNKSNLIDCMCNYFYGAKFDGARYKIADEIFDRHSTPMKSITKYVFNATAMSFRPVIIDTPEITIDSELPMKTTARTLHDFLVESPHIHINALCIVLKFDEASISKDEKIISEAINLFPPYMLPSTIILFSSNDEKPSLPPSIKLVLRDLNLNYNKFYFFSDYYLKHNKENKQDDEIEKQKERQSWNLSMSELDRFFEQVRRLNPRQIIPDENIEFLDKEMMQHTSAFAPSTRAVPHERIIPIKMVDRESISVKTSAALKNWNSPVIKRYFYDPEAMTHREYVMSLQKNGKLSAGEYVNVHNFDTVTPIYKAHETLINDIPPENQAMKGRELSSDEDGVAYLYVRSTPPPEYSTEAVAVLHQPSDDAESGKTKIKKRLPTAIDMESQQKTYSQYSKSAVQRQIARRTSSGSEHSKSYGLSPQQQQLPKRQIKQTNQVIKSRASQRQNDQEHRNYLKTPKMKRSKSPILLRLLMSKKKLHPSTSFTDAQEQLDKSFEQPRALETDQSLQSPLRSYGQLIHDDEMEEERQGGTIHLSEESPTTAAISRQILRTEKAWVGMKSGRDVNERDELLDVKELNLEEGLTPHPYKTDPWTMNRRTDKVGADGVGLMEVKKTTYSTWNWINCCFYLLAPLFIFFIIIAIIITLALLA
ncbi:hypothetical protein QQG55_47475 [Brugia pahangi]